MNPKNCVGRTTRVNSFSVNDIRFLRDDNSKNLQKCKNFDGMGKPT